MFGRYTAYNIELQTGAPASSAVPLTDPIASTTSVVTEVVEHVVESANKHIAHLIENLLTAHRMGGAGAEAARAVDADTTGPPRTGAAMAWVFGGSVAAASSILSG